MKSKHERKILACGAHVTSMRPNYKNIAIASGVVGLVFLFVAGVSSNQNKNAAETQTNIQAEVSPLPTVEDIEPLREEVKQRIEEVEAALTNSPLKEQQNGTVSEDDYAPEDTNQSVNSTNTRRRPVVSVFPWVFIDKMDVIYYKLLNFYLTNYIYYRRY
jgi:hypothetical protein